MTPSIAPAFQSLPLLLSLLLFLANMFPWAHFQLFFYLLTLLLPVQLNPGKSYYVSALYLHSCSWHWCVLRDASNSCCIPIMQSLYHCPGGLFHSSVTWSFHSSPPSLLWLCELTSHFTEQQEAISGDLQVSICIIATISLLLPLATPSLFIHRIIVPMIHPFLSHTSRFPLSRWFSLSSK